MSAITTSDEILDFAIAREKEAQAFYLNLAGRVGRQNMKDLFKHFASQEKKHEEKLAAVKEGQRFLVAGEKVADLKLAEMLKEPQVTEGGLDYQDALTLAMQREKKAFQLYTKLAEAAEDPEIKAVFESLAGEEAKHKLYIETEYDDKILTDN